MVGSQRSKKVLLPLANSFQIEKNAKVLNFICIFMYLQHNPRGTILPNQCLNNRWLKGKIKPGLLVSVITVCASLYDHHKAFCPIPLF